MYGDNDHKVAPSYVIGYPKKGSMRLFLVREEELDSILLVNIPLGGGPF